MKSYTDENDYYMTVWLLKRSVLIVKIFL